MGQPKDYQGLKVVEHVVGAGQTLSKIAQLYRMPSWQPIVTYNTKVHRILRSGAPEHLRSGQRILIPRSPKGYDRWDACLGGLVGHLEGFEMAENATLDALMAEKDAFAVKLDLVGDVLTLFASLAVKAGQAAKAVGLADDAAREGSSVVNALQFSWASVEGYVAEADSLFELLGRQFKAAQKATRTAGGEKLFDKIAGPELALVRKVLKAGIKEPNLLQKLGAGVKGLLEYTDWLKPSTQSQWLLVLIAGETVDATVHNQRDAIAASVERYVKVLKAKQLAVREEKTLVWG